MVEIVESLHTPRPLIKVITDIVKPTIGQTIYDPAVGSCGFLIEAYNHIRYTDVQKQTRTYQQIN